MAIALNLIRTIARGLYVGEQMSGAASIGLTQSASGSESVTIRSVGQRPPTPCLECPSIGAFRDACRGRRMDIGVHGMMAQDARPACLAARQLKPMLWPIRSRRVVRAERTLQFLNAGLVTDAAQRISPNLGFVLRQEPGAGIEGSVSPAISTFGDDSVHFQL